MAGAVLVDDAPVTKAGSPVLPDQAVRLKAGHGGDGWASRGALKLSPALDAFGVEAQGRVCLDIGASTGGFTDVLLRRGASRVYAVDVGYGQLAGRLRNDDRVVVLDRTNARHLTCADVPEPIGLVTIDVSFISVRLILPAVVPLLDVVASVLVMVKPQFEVGRGRVGKGGVVRSEALRAEAADSVASMAVELGWVERGRRDNEITGPKGNREIFLLLSADNS